MIRNSKPATYAWANPVFEGKANPAKVAVELKKLDAIGDDTLLPDAVVDYARSHPRSELHKLFPWDDSEAADLNRRGVARNIIRGLRIIYPDSKTQEPLRVYVRPAESGGYHTVVEVNASEAMTASMRARALSDLLAWARRYDELIRRLPAVDKAIKNVVSVLSEAQKKEVAKAS